MTDMTDDWNIARALCCTSCLQVLPSARSFCTVCQTASLRGRASCCKELLNLKRLKMAEEAGKHTDLPTIHKRCPNDQTPIYIFNYLTILNLDFLRFLLILSTHLSLSLSLEHGSWAPGCPVKEQSPHSAQNLDEVLGSSTPTLIQDLQGRS